MASPGPANSLLSRASFANGDERFYSRESAYSLYSPNNKDFGGPFTPQTPSVPDHHPSHNTLNSNLSSLETVKDLDEEGKDIGGSNDLSELRHNDYVRSLQEENRRLERELRRKEEEVKQRDEEIRRKDEQMKKADQELEKMQKEMKRMAEEELVKKEGGRRREREIEQDGNRKIEDLGARREINKGRKEKEDAETTRIANAISEQARLGPETKEQEIEERERALKEREEELERRKEYAKKLRELKELWRQNDRRKTEKEISPAQKIVEHFNRQRVEADESALERNRHKGATYPYGGMNMGRPYAPEMVTVPLPAVSPSSALPKKLKQEKSTRTKPLPNTSYRHPLSRNPLDNYIPILNDATIDIPPPHELTMLDQPNKPVALPSQPNSSDPVGILAVRNTPPGFDLLSPLTYMANLKPYPPGFTPAQPTRPM